MAHSLLWRHIALLKVGVYSSKHGELYTIKIGITKRFKKKCRFVYPIVTQTKNPTPLLIVKK